MHVVLHLARSTRRLQGLGHEVSELYGDLWLQSTVKYDDDDLDNKRKSDGCPGREVRRERKEDDVCMTCCGGECAGFLESEMHTRGNDIADWRILLTLYPIARARTRYM